jgi:hypothetical protein
LPDATLVGVRIVSFAFSPDRALSPCQVGMLTVDGGGALVTVTVAEALIVFVPFDAIAVYVVLTLGLTLFELFRPTEPIPLSIVTDVAFVDVHVSVVDPPAAMDVGLADN